MERSICLDRERSAQHCRLTQQIIVQIDLHIQSQLKVWPCDLVQLVAGGGVLGNFFSLSRG